MGFQDDSTVLIFMHEPKTKSYEFINEQDKVFFDETFKHAAFICEGCRKAGKCYQERIYHDESLDWLYSECPICKAALH